MSTAGDNNSEKNIVFDGEEFLESTKFVGSKVGYVFHLGEKGLGYYRDPYYGLTNEEILHKFSDGIYRNKIAESSSAFSRNGLLFTSGIFLLLSIILGIKYKASLTNIPESLTSWYKFIRGDDYSNVDDITELFNSTLEIAPLLQYAVRPKILLNMTLSSYVEIHPFIITPFTVLPDFRHDIIPSVLSRANNPYFGPQLDVSVPLRAPAYNYQNIESSQRNDYERKFVMDNMQKDGPPYFSFVAVTPEDFVDPVLLESLSALGAGTEHTSLTTTSYSTLHVNMKYNRHPCHSTRDITM